MGDAAAFPNATFIMGGDAEEFLSRVYPVNPASNVLQTSIPISRTRFIRPSEWSQSIGPFPRAHDYFGDGSMYIIDAAGHLPGHVNILARTNGTGSWIYLAGDTAHDMRLLKGEREVAVLVDDTGKTICAHSDKEKAVEHIARVRMFVAHAADADAVGAAVKDALGDVEPAATMIVGARFVAPEMRVEIEADAVVLG